MAHNHAGPGHQATRVDNWSTAVNTSAPRLNGAWPGTHTPDRLSAVLLGIMGAISGALVIFAVLSLIREVAARRNEYENSNR